MSRGPYIVTASGIRFYPLDPRPEEVELGDIAHALSNQCRFSGHTSSFYSVAQHSCLVADNVPSRDALHGLLHDASEAYLVDLPRPLKRDPELGDRYRAIESRLARVIGERFDLAGEEPASVLEADKRACMTEKRDLLPPCPLDWGWYDLEPFPERIVPWTPEEAEFRFLARYRRLARGLRVAA